MPFINIKVLKGTLSDEKKSEMIKRDSEAVAEIEANPKPKDNLGLIHGVLSKRLILQHGE
jgi:hypothetical protein